MILPRHGTERRASSDKVVTVLPQQLEWGANGYGGDYKYLVSSPDESAGLTEMSVDLICRCTASPNTSCTGLTAVI